MKSKTECTCACHKGAMVVHMRKMTEAEKKDKGIKKDSFSNTHGTYISDLIMSSCPCDLNIKIAELTKEYYER